MEANGKPVFAADGMEVRGGYPGGNVRVLGFDRDAGVVRVEPDMRDSSGRWFHWDFEIAGAAGRTLRFQFPEGYEYLSSLGPAISRDGGGSWEWLCSDGTRHEPANAFEYAFGPGENRTRFAMSFPYVQSDWDAFTSKLRGRGDVEFGVLCKSQSGRRDTELLRVKCGGKADWLFVFTARHHACEASANPVMEGVAEEILSGSPEGEWARQNAECFFATTCEFGYSLCGGVYSREAARELGRNMAKAIVRTVSASHA